MKILKNYFLHLFANWKVAFRAFLLRLFHFLHGIIPCKYTEHEYWGLRLYKEVEFDREIKFRGQRKDTKTPDILPVREIKFRAWDEENQEMIYDVDYSLGHAVKPGYLWWNSGNTLIHSRPMQYIGVRDKHGKEIYEGDIVKDISEVHGERYGVVRWFEEDPGFVVEPLDRWYDYQGKDFVWQELEVVGNIYEADDELLKKIGLEVDDGETEDPRSL